MRRVELRLVIGAIRRCVARLVTTVRGGRADAQLEREIAAHLDQLEARFVHEGMTRDDARAAARRAFGGVAQVQEHQREARSFHWLDDAVRDSIYAVRSLSRSPAFALAAILTLAIGIGAATTIYSVVDDVLLQPLPFPDADQLVRVSEFERPPSMPRSTYQEFLDWRSRATTLADLATMSFNPQLTVRMPNGTSRVTEGLVSPNYFDVLGVRPALGRTITAADAADPNVAVLSFETWQKHFGGDPKAIGSVIRAGDVRVSPRTLTIVGVLRDDMEHFGTPIELYSPLPVNRDPRTMSISGSLIGRLRDGVSLAAATAEANLLGNALRPPRPSSAPPLTRERFGVTSLKDDVVASLRPALRVFLGAVAVVLAIACANVANLLLARGSARRREFAVRLALGAGRGRIARQVLAECMVLALTGGAIGAVLAAGGVTMVKRLATLDAQGVFKIILGQNVLPRAAEVTIDLRLFMTALALGLVTSVVFGLLPALHVSSPRDGQALGSRGGGGQPRDTRTRAILVVAQLAMATVLLIGAGLLAASFMNLTSVNKGYDPAHVLAFQLVIPDEYPPARKSEVVESVLARTRTLPGTTAAGFAYSGIMVSVQNTVGSFVPPGRTLDDVSKERDRPRLKTISPGYLEAVGARLLDGRLLIDADATPASPAIVVNRTVARRYMGVVGSYLDWYVGKQPPLRARIVGVIEDIRQDRLDREPYGEVFMDYRLIPALQTRLDLPPRAVENLAFGFMSFAIRTSSDPRGSIEGVRRAVAATDPIVGIDAILPLERLVGDSVARQRFYAAMLGTFAVVAALLAALGTYGVLAYAVVQRTQEIGIRVALGARPRQVLSMVLRRGLILTAIGIALGVAGAYLGTRYLQTMLFGLTPLDARTFAVVTAGFFAVAALACYLPARRATEVDPMVTLRAE